jgi:8-amino-7-oxononanoate synthase
MIKDKIKNELLKLEQESLIRKIPEIENGISKYIEKNNKKLLNLSSNNYLGISEHRFLIKSAIKATEKYGTTSGASRVVSGNFTIYDELELLLAKFKQAEKSLIFNSGYTANISIISALADKNTVIFSDKLNHASIIDGIKISRAKHVRYIHNDIEHLKFCIDKYSSVKNKILVTDTIFSMDGDIARLEEIVNLSKQNNIFTIIDEAHATGVFGKGKGIAFEKNLHDEIDLHMGTFSKGLGSFGAYVSSKKYLIDYLINKSRGFIYTTSLPPAVIGANIASIKFVQNHPEISQRLIDISNDLRVFLKKIGFNIYLSETQIIPIILKDNERTLKAAKFLEDNCIMVGAIRPPTVPKDTSRLRLSLRADLNDNEVQYIKDTFTKLYDFLS